LVASFDKNNRNGDSLKKKQTYVLEKPGEKLLLWLGEKKRQLAVTQISVGW
jgi:hypothetical protein